MMEELVSLLSIYEWPSQAFWRYFELKMLRQIEYKRPILEIGCGDGRFSALIFDVIDEAIDIDSFSVDKCMKFHKNLYIKVRCLDARTQLYNNGEYATIVANCVMEHISDIKGVLSGCFKGLKPGGRLIITIPLKSMNNHLLLPWGWYAAFRRRQLFHVNLLEQNEWEALLRGVGFYIVEIRQYLFEKECKFWDTLDGIGCIGYGRYSLSNAIRLLARIFLSQRSKERISRMVSEYIMRKYDDGWHTGEACAALMIATKR